MDKLLIFLFASVIVISGCADVLQTNSAPEGAKPDPGKGLEITSLSVADNSIRAGEGGKGQRTEVQLILSNHHSTSIDPEIRLANTGQLITQGDNPSEAQCSQESLAAVKNEVVDQMRCTWGIYAPSQEVLGDFDQKSASLSVIMEYDSQITNQDPLRVNFKPADRIESSSDVERKFSNSEVQMTLRANNPAAINSASDSFEISLSNGGNGGVISSGYDISYDPNIMADSCPRDDAVGRIGSQYTEKCSFDVSSSATRRLLVSAEYKYQKQQNLPITIVR